MSFVSSCSHRTNDRLKNEMELEDEAYRNITPDDGEENAQQGVQDDVETVSESLQSEAVDNFEECHLENGARKTK